MRHLRTPLVTLALIGLVVTGCIDGIGPRPRPGTTDPDGPGGGGNGGTAVLQWFEVVPRVLTHNVTDSVTLNISVSGNPEFVTVYMRAGQPLELQRSSGNIYSARLPAGNLLFGYREGDLHQVGALIEIGTADSISEHPVVFNVKDATVPNASVATIAPGLQMTEHVLNIRHDVVSPGTPTAASVIRTFYNNFADDFDLLVIVEAVRSKQPAFYTSVRNNVSGLGLPLFDNGAGYGSASRLEGIIQYPDGSQFDLGRTDNIHEIAHRWMNYLEHPLVAQARTHWPLSTLASGVLGRKSPVTGLGSPFPFTLILQPNGSYLAAHNTDPAVFNDMELYLMGLLPADSVQPHIVFANQNQSVGNGTILSGPTDTLEISDVIATNGPRVPGAGPLPRDIKIGTIVLSRGDILTRHELDFFEHVAARGEAKTPLPFSNGVVRGISLPFFLATSKRATLTTELRNLQ